MNKQHLVFAISFLCIWPPTCTAVASLSMPLHEQDSTQAHNDLSISDS